MVDRGTSSMGQPMWPEAMGMPAAGGLDSLLRESSWRLMTSGAPVLESRLALGLERRNHFHAVWDSHPDQCRRRSHRHTVEENPTDKESTAESRQLRLTMRHESLAFAVSWIPTTRIGRLSPVNDLFVKPT
jgi:hypothetical protein